MASPTPRHATHRSGGLKNRNAPRASLACLRCRERKIKCDVQAREGRGLCTPCQSSGTQCIVRHDDDRKRASMASSSNDHYQVQSPLLHRDVTLPILHANGQVVSNENTHLISQNSTSFSIDNISHPLRPWEDEPRMATSSLLQSAQEDRPETFSTGAVDGGAVLHPPSSSKPIESARVRATSASYEDDRQVKPKVRLRCFGPTCPLHVLLRPTPPKSPEIAAENPDAYTWSLDSEQFQRELLNIYFDFQPLSIIVINKEAFMEHYSIGLPSEYYSEFLLNCILACAVRLSTRVAIRSLSELYIKRAKTHLVDALEHAIIATLQGFCLLSEFEMSSGNDQAGWLYAGIACRLLFDLGLHQDCTDLVRIGHLSESEAAIRRQVFFGCMVNERLWCIYLGRPSLIKLPDFSTPKPKIADPSFETQTQAAWVDLSILSSEIADIFNCPSLIDEQTIRRLIEVDARLHSWYDSLPPVLSWKGSREMDLHSCVFALHMQFYGIQILVFRTSIMTRRKFSPAAFSEEEICKLRGLTLDQSRLLYRDSAMQIARLLIAFQQKVGIERVPTVMLDNLYIATIALISYVSKKNGAQDVVENEIQCIVSLLDSLETLQTHYQVARRMRLTLSDVLERSWLANSVDSPLYHKLSIQNTNAASTQSSDHVALSRTRKPPYSRKTPPVFDMADLWIIPENYGGDIGYPQPINAPEIGHLADEDMDSDRGLAMDMGTFYVNGMDLLEM
ncbi:hypothetical protein B7463_g9888, partial [Scytalidium lignicola]